MHGPHARTAGRARSSLLSPHPRASSPLLGVGDEARGSAQVAGCSLRSRDGGTAGGVWVQSVSDPRATDCAQTTAEAACHTHEAARPEDGTAPTPDGRARTTALGDAGRRPCAVCPAFSSPNAVTGRLSEAKCRNVPRRTQVTLSSSLGAVRQAPRTVDETAATPRAGTKAAPTEVRPGPRHAVTGAGHAGGSTCTAARDKDRFAGSGAQTQLLGPFK